MRIVVALGGNALVRRGGSADAATQRENVSVAVRALAALAVEHELVGHARQRPAGRPARAPGRRLPAARALPLDVLGAETEGMIGYLIEQELINALGGRSVATLLTQVIVDGDDPAFFRPTKFIGPVYDRATADRLAVERGWAIAADGAHWRRVVPSPEPRSIVELPTIRLLAEAGAGGLRGGGGIPVSSTATAGCAASRR